MVALERRTRQTLPRSSPESEQAPTDFDWDGGPFFVPTLLAPDRIPPNHFVSPERPGELLTLLSCRHGLVLFINHKRLEALVFDPVTARRCCIAFPPEVNVIDSYQTYHGALIRDFVLFVILVFKSSLASAWLYESGPGKWRKITSAVVPTSLVQPSVLVGNALYWIFTRAGGTILELDMDRQSLDVIQHPKDIQVTQKTYFQVLRADDGGLGLALDGLISLTPSMETRPTSIVGVDEDSDVIFLWSTIGVFMIHLESLQFMKLPKDSWRCSYFPYRSFYTAGCGIDDVSDTAEKVPAAAYQVWQDVNFGQEMGRHSVLYQTMRSLPSSSDGAVAGGIGRAPATSSPYAAGTTISTFQMSEGRASPAPASLPDNDDMLQEILLRLPPLPSSLPRASLVCKRWRRLLSDPGFLRRFRVHHRTPPLLGYFYESYTSLVFVPMLDPPNRIPSARFSLPQRTSRSWTFLGCRHGLAAFLDVTRREAVVWEPFTGSQCHIPFPPEVKFDKDHYALNGGVLSATGKYGDGYVRNDRQMSPFKLALLFCNAECKVACASIYESESGKWGSISSIAIPEYGGYLFDPAVLVGNALYWFLCWRGNILEFDLDTQSLAIIQMPEDARFTDESSFKVLGTEDRGVCLAIISEQSMQLWGRKANSNGTNRWVLQKTVELDQLLSVRRSRSSFPTSILGFDEDSGVIFLLMDRDIFTIKLQSMQFKKHSCCATEYLYPYRSFYAAGVVFRLGQDEEMEVGVIRSVFCLESLDWGNGTLALDGAVAGGFGNFLSSYGDDQWVLLRCQSSKIFPADYGFVQFLPFAAISAVQMREGRASPAPASLPDNEDMLQEILLRLPPLPSSLPRASLVCKRWRRLLLDPQFIRHFRAHHQTPPLLGYFYKSFTEPVFVPMLDPPNHIPSARFSLPEPTSRSWTFLGCRHGLTAFLDVTRMEAVVWEPVTGSQCRFPLPQEVKFDEEHYIFNGAVLSATGNYADGYVHSDRQISPFKLVLLFNNGEEKVACASIYESESRKWGNVSSIAIPDRHYLYDPAVLVGNALYWFLCWGGDILEFDLDTQSLAMIQRPENAHFTGQSFFNVLGTDGGLILAIVSKQSMQLWGRKANSNGTIRWVLQKTVELDQLLSVRPSRYAHPTTILGFDEDGSVIFLLMDGDIFTIKLESMQFEKHPLKYFIAKYYPYRSFYAAGCDISGGDERPEMS
ncbi:hypothetical protein EJB05_35138, partial [Eragrostis curvula]